MSKNNKEYDQNIISALKSLPVPLKTFDGHSVLFNEDKRNETIFEHIANKHHHLHVVDIQIVPFILNNKNCLMKDRSGKRFRTYIGKRRKPKERLKYLKIVTEIKKNKNESVVTIYPVKK